MKDGTTRPPSMAVFLSALIFALLAGSTWASDHSGIITNDTTWYAADNPHVIVGNINVSDSAALTLEDGVEVRFDTNMELIIGYCCDLIAVGTPGNGILFTRNGASNGGGIVLGGQATLDYCTIEYSNIGIHVGEYADTISISNCTLQNNSRGIWMEGGVVEMSSCTVANHSDYGLRGDGLVPTFLNGNNVFENNYRGMYLRNISGLSLITMATFRNNTRVGLRLENCTSNATLDNMIFEGNDGIFGALYLETCGEFTIGSNNTFGGTGVENSWPVTMNAPSWPSAASSGHIPTTGNTNNGIQVYGGWSSSGIITWRSLGIDYIVTNYPNFSGTLEIEDGVTVKFEHDEYIRVNGTLNAIGSAGILFTRYQADDQWTGLQFYSGSGGTLRHCTIEYANRSGGSGIYGNDAFPSIEHCTLRNNYYGIRARDVVSPVLDTANTIQDNEYAGVCFEQCPHPSLFNQTITGHTGIYGAVFMDRTGEFTIGAGNVIGGTGVENSWPVTINLGSYPSVSCAGNIPVTGNTHNGIQVYGGTSADSVAWRDMGLDYVVTAVPTVSAGGTLEIADSVTVCFENARYIDIDGTLNAIGTSSILFTRYEPDDQWGGLHFSSGSGGTLQHCTVEYVTYSTGYGILADGAFPAIESCTIRNNDYGIYAKNIVSPALSMANVIEDNSIAGVCFYNCTHPSLSHQTITGHNTTYGAIFMDRTGEFTIGAGNVIGGTGVENSWPVTINLGSYPSVSCAGNIPVTGNTHNGIQVYGGTSADSVAWRDMGLDYVVTAVPTVSEGGTLEIADSVTVCFENARYIDIDGTLNAIGTSSILFTRYEPDDEWGGLHFSSGSGGTLQHCTIEHATYTTGYGIYAQSSTDTISLSGCTIRNNDYGVYATGGVLSFQNNAIIDNANYGIYLSGYVPVIFGSDLGEWNDIYNNGGGSEGRDLRNGTLDTYAPYVYWGTVNSPEIDTRIWDVQDDTTLGAVCYAPWSNAKHDQTTALWLTIGLEGGAKSSSGDMHLDWTEYCGQAVDHYVVYRSTTANAKGDSLDGTTESWYLDVGAAGTVGTNYYYTVEVVDGVGGRFDSNQVGEFDIGLINGLKATGGQRRLANDR